MDGLQFFRHGASPSVVIDKLDMLRPLFSPHEAQTEWIVDADAVLAGAVPFQGFQPVARRWRKKLNAAAAFN